MKKYTKVKSRYGFLDLFELKWPKCPLLIPDTVLMEKSKERGCLTLSREAGAVVLQHEAGAVAEYS